MADILQKLEILPSLVNAFSELILSIISQFIPRIFVFRIELNFDWFFHSRFVVQIVVGNT